jgi:hypothetical protein
MRCRKKKKSEEIAKKQLALCFPMMLVLELVCFPAPWSDLGASCTLWGAARSGRAPASSFPPASEGGFYLRFYEYRSKWRPALTKSHGRGATTGSKKQTCLSQTRRGPSTRPSLSPTTPTRESPSCLYPEHNPNRRGEQTWQKETPMAR